MQNDASVQGRVSKHELFNLSQTLPGVPAELLERFKPWPVPSPFVPEPSKRLIPKPHPFRKLPLGDADPGTKDGAQKRGPQPVIAGRSSRSLFRKAHATR